MSQKFLSWKLGFFVPLLLWILYTPFSSFFDLQLSDFFYNHFQFSEHFLTGFIYVYALFPAWCVILAAILLLIASFFNKRLSSYKNAFIYLLLTFIIGPGLFIHLVFKENWGRPRPKQVIEYGGTQQFRPYYQPNIFHQPEPSKSFTCGHCSMGFYFFSFIFLSFAYKSRRLYLLGMGLSWGLGGVISLARIAQGGHFLSDTLASALIMWYTCLMLYPLCFKVTHDKIGNDGHQQTLHSDQNQRQILSLRQKL